MDEAPKEIWAGPGVDDKGEYWDTGHWDTEWDKGNPVKYLRADLAAAREAAAYVGCRRECLEMAERVRGVNDDMELAYLRAAEAIRALATSDQTAALEARDKQVWEKAIKSAVQYLRDEQAYYEAGADQLNLVSLKNVAHTCRVMANGMEQALIYEKRRRR